jgi:predicted anti-sigma-YlaC factor YlaD
MFYKGGPKHDCPFLKFINGRPTITASLPTMINASVGTLCGAMTNRAAAAITGIWHRVIDRSSVIVVTIVRAGASSTMKCLAHPTAQPAGGPVGG